MNNNKNIKIYSINIENSDNQATEIETVVLNGLYKFTILGVNSKNNSDIKDRVYSALRYEKILNLKSDNKKITVNITPNIIDERVNIYDLGIAISCYFSINNKEKIDIDKLLTIGELSITGNIIKSGFILKALHIAIKNNVNTIICAKEDIKTLDKITYLNWHKIIHKNKIKFIVADTIKEAVDNIKSNNYYKFNKNETIKNTKEKPGEIRIFNKNIFKIILSMCGKYNSIIEHQNNSYIEKFIKNIIYYNQKNSEAELLCLSNILNLKDNILLNKYNTPIVLYFNKHRDYIKSVRNNIFGLNIIEDINDTNDISLNETINNNKTTLFAFYKKCPCGNNEPFFEFNSNMKCFCLQRNIIRHKQKIKNIDKDLFDLQIKNNNNSHIIEETTDIKKFYEFYHDYDYININKFIKFFKDQNINIPISTDIKTYMTDLKERIQDNILFDKIIKVSKDICKFNHLNNNKSNMLSKSDIIIAEQMIKKDF